MSKKNTPLSRQQSQFQAQNYFNELNNHSSARPSMNTPLNLRSGTMSPVKKHVGDVQQEEALVTNNIDTTYQNAYKLLKHLLYKYEEALVKQNVLTIIKSSDKLCTFQTIEKLHPDIIYLLASIQPKELHELFVQFYRIFDVDNDFTISFNEFNQIFQMMAGENYMGAKKIQVIIDIMILRDEPFFQGGDKQMGENIDLETVKELYDQFDKVFFPFLLSFYFQYFLAETKRRRDTYDLVRGIEIIGGKEEEIKNIFSLNSILKEIGVRYKEDKDKRILSYRDIENILLKYKHLNQWMTYDHIKDILQVFEKKMKVEYRTKVEARRLSTRKVLHLLALKICINQDCQIIKSVIKDDSPVSYLEVVEFFSPKVMLFWHTSVNAHLLANKGKLLKENLLKCIEKHYPDELINGQVVPRQLNKEELQEVLEKYFRKRFPMMSKTNFMKLIQGFDLFKYEDEDALVTKTEIITTMFERICNRGDMKLRDYMDKNKIAQNKVKQLKDKRNSMKLSMKGSQAMSQISGSDQQMSQISSPNKLPEDDSQEEKPKKVVPKDILKSCFIMENFLEKYVHKHVKNFEGYNQHAKSYLAEEKKNGDDNFNLDDAMKRHDHNKHSHKGEQIQDDQEEDNQQYPLSDGTIRTIKKFARNAKNAIIQHTDFKVIEEEKQEDDLDDQKQAATVIEVLGNVQGMQVQANKNFKMIEQEKKLLTGAADRMRLNNNQNEEIEEAPPLTEAEIRRQKRLKRTVFVINTEELKKQVQQQKEYEQENRRDRCCVQF